MRVMTADLGLVEIPDDAEVIRIQVDNNGSLWLKSEDDSPLYLFAPLAWQVVEDLPHGVESTL